MASFRIWFSKNGKPDKTWVVEADNGASITLRQLKICAPVVLAPEIPSEVPRAWIACEGNLIKEGNDWLIR